ncbi:MAG: protein-L-isoaspartate(D-aspartate) O-methyltransferase [Pirellulaceae bacterium]
MKGFRPLLVGIVLAALWLVASTLWQLIGARGGGQVDVPPVSPAPDLEQQDNDVWRTSDPQAADEIYAERRRQMVERQLAARDITNKEVLETMRTVPRHLFVPDKQLDHAYVDGPLPIGHDQTISQPYIVALMTQLAHPHPSAVALDVGTGSGYQAAVLSRLCKQVYSIEIVEPLADLARERLAALGYRNVTVRAGDGYAGWPEHAPFDLIIVAAAPDHVPHALIEQLRPGGRLVIPVGKSYQKLTVVHKQPDGSVRQEPVIPVAFVPMTGQAQEKQ